MTTDLFGEAAQTVKRRYPSQSPERAREYRRRHKEGHPETSREKGRIASARWRANHPEQAKAIKHAWQKRCGAQKDRERRRRNFEKKNLKAQMLYNARDRAKKRRIAFTITEADIHIPQTCPILGIPLKANRGRWGMDSPSLDRVDVGKGYIPGNVRVVSFKANKFKSDHTIDEIMALARYVSEHLGKRRDEEERRQAAEAAAMQA